MPEVAMLAQLGWLLYNNKYWSAIKTFTAFRTYIRPGVLDNMRVKSLVAPESSEAAGFPQWGFVLNPSQDFIPGKTGIYEASVLWDSDLWLAPVFAHLIQNRPAEHILFPVSATQSIDDFNQSAGDLGLAPLRPCRYGYRHGGASEDLRRQRRSQLNVKGRGHWTSDSSLRRYAKETALLAEVNKLPKSTLDYGERIRVSLQDLLLCRCKAPAPPVVIGAMPIQGERRQRRKLA